MDGVAQTSSPDRVGLLELAAQAAGGSLSQLRGDRRVSEERIERRERPAKASVNSETDLVDCERCGVAWLEKLCTGEERSRQSNVGHSTHPTSKICKPNPNTAATAEGTSLELADLTVMPNGGTGK